MFGFTTYVSHLLSPEASGMDLSSIKVVLSGGSVVPSSLRKILKQKLPSVKTVVVVSL